MKQILIGALLYFCALIGIKLSAQNDVGTLILDKLSKQRYFEAEDLYNANKDSIDLFVSQFYQAKQASLCNEQVKSSFIFIEIIRRYNATLPADLRLYIIQNLFENTISINDSANFQIVFDYANDYLKDNPDRFTASKIQELRAWVDNFQDRFLEETKASLLPIKRSAKISSAKLIDSLNLIQTSASINGRSSSVILDTGLSRDLVCTPKFAERLGLEVTYIEGKLNSEKKKLGKSLIDSLEIGGVTVYNVPVLVVKTDVPNLNKEHKNKKVRKELKLINGILEKPIIGLGLMRRLGYIELDFKKNEIVFPTSEMIKEDRYKEFRLKSRLLAFNEGLFFRLFINKQATTLFLDTGANFFIELEPKFYNKYKTAFPIDKYSEKEHTFTFNNLYKGEKIPIVKLKTLSFEDSKIFEPLISSFSENNVVVFEHHNNFTPYADGMAGLPFLRSLGSRVLLDLNDMKIKGFND